MPTPPRIESEDDLIALGVEEQYDIERKAGAALADLSKFRDLLAEAVCALANFGGGLLVLGQKNNKVEFDGLPETWKDRPTHEWLSQLIPGLVVPTLGGIRVYAVKKGAASMIPDGQNVYVVEVPDSPFAPHQTKESRQYFYREGCITRRAPHFYLEALRSRLIAPILKISGCELQLGSTGWEPEGRRPMFDFCVSANVVNEGRVACHRWAVRYDFTNRPTALWTPHDGWVGPTDEVILHSARKQVQMHFGLPMPDNEGMIPGFMGQLSSLTLQCCVVSEHGPGEPIAWPLDAWLTDGRRKEIKDRCLGWLHRVENRRSPRYSQ